MYFFFQQFFWKKNKKTTLDGPWSARISGPDTAEVGSNVTLNCSASSQPPSQYSWFFQGFKVAEGSVYQTDSLSLNSSGKYTCLAHNNITGTNSSTTWNLTVIGRS